MDAPEFYGLDACDNEAEMQHNPNRAKMINAEKLEVDASLATGRRNNQVVWLESMGVAVTGDEVRPALPLKLFPPTRNARANDGILLAAQRQGAWPIENNLPANFLFLQVRAGTLK